MSLFQKQNEPLTFTLLRLEPNEFAQLKKLIIDNGGAVSKHDKNVRIKFTSKSVYENDMCPGSIVYDIDFIRQCVKNSCFVDAEQYKLSRNYEGDECVMTHFLLGFCYCKKLGDSQSNDDILDNSAKPTTEVSRSKPTVTNGQATVQVCIDVTSPKVCKSEKTNNSSSIDKSQPDAARSRIMDQHARLSNDGEIISDEDETDEKPCSTNGRRSLNKQFSPTVSSARKLVSTPQKKSSKNEKAKSSPLPLSNRFHNGTKLKVKIKAELEDNESSKTATRKPRLAITMEPEEITDDDIEVTRCAIPAKTTIKTESPIIIDEDIEPAHRASPILKRMSVEHESIDYIESSQSVENLRSRKNHQRELRNESSPNRPGPSGVTHRSRVFTHKDLSSDSDTEVDDKNNREARKCRNVFSKTLKCLKRSDNNSETDVNAHTKSVDETTSDKNKQRKTKDTAKNLGKKVSTPRKDPHETSTEEEASPPNPKSRKLSSHRSKSEINETDCEEISDFSNSDESDNPTHDKRENRGETTEKDRTDGTIQKTAARSLNLRKTNAGSSRWYTDTERELMLKFLVNTRTIPLAKGMKIYELMAHEPGLQHRSPMSLNLHFLRHILPNIDLLARKLKLDSKSIKELKRLVKNSD